METVGAAQLPAVVGSALAGPAGSAALSALRGEQRGARSVRLTTLMVWVRWAT